MTAASRNNETLTRLLPFILGLAIVVAGYIWLVQPKMTQYLRSRSDITTAEAQAKSLQDQVSLGRTSTTSDEAAALRLFEQRVSAEDRVPDVVELLAKMALDSAPKGTVKALQIQTGQSAQWPSAVSQPARGTGEPDASPDPRLGLFPVTLTYTPVTVSFEGSYQAVQQFAWRLRDLPTMIEIRSLELARGLPLMKAAFQLYVYQRGAVPAVPQPADAAGAPAAPQAPRVARLSMAGEW